MLHVISGLLMDLKEIRQRDLNNGHIEEKEYKEIEKAEEYFNNHLEELEEIIQIHGQLEDSGNMHYDLIHELRKLQDEILNRIDNDLNKEES